MGFGTNIANMVNVSREKGRKKALNLFLPLWCQKAERGKIKSEGGNKEILNWMYVCKKERLKEWRKVKIK